MTSDDELLELEHRYVDAWFRFDEALVRELTLPDATWINQSGRLADFEESLDIYRSPASRLDRSEETGLRVRVYGDTAVVTGDWHVAKGERSGQLRITRVWVRGDDRRWRMAAWHGSAVGATAPERRPDALGAA